MRSFPSVILLFQLVITQFLLTSFAVAAVSEATAGPACPPQIWGMNQYTCRWKSRNPDATVAATFGERAAYKFGSKISLFQALAGGEGIELLSTILAEAVAALLNADMYGEEFGLTAEEAVSALVTATEVPADNGRVILQKLQAANNGICSLEPCN